MKRHALVPALFLFGMLALFGCAMTAADEEDIDAIEVVDTTEEVETEEVSSISCKGQCLQILRACLRAAETDEDRAECALNHDACIADCNDCDDPAPCPFPD